MSEMEAEAAYSTRRPLPHVKSLTSTAAMLWITLWRKREASQLGTLRSTSGKQAANEALYKSCNYKHFKRHHWIFRLQARKSGLCKTPSPASRPSTQRNMPSGIRITPTQGNVAAHLVLIPVGMRLQRLDRIAPPGAIGILRNPVDPFRCWQRWQQIRGGH